MDVSYSRGPLRKRHKKGQELYGWLYENSDFSPDFFFTLRQNIVELVLWGGYSFIFIGKAGNGANYTARSIKCHAFGWNVPNNRGVLASSDVFL